MRGLGLKRPACRTPTRLPHTDRDRFVMLTVRASHSDICRGGGRINRTGSRIKRRISECDRKHLAGFEAFHHLRHGVPSVRDDGLYDTDGSDCYCPKLGSGYSPCFRQFFARFSVLCALPLARRSFTFSTSSLTSSNARDAWNLTGSNPGEAKESHPVDEAH